jgi:RNA polymerase sigma factor (sigma-70 family)
LADLAAELEPHIPALRRYAWALLRHREAADDLVQDVLERAISRWHFRRKDVSTRAWLLTISRNLFLNGVRQGRRQGRHVQLDDVEISAPEPGADRTLIARDALTALQGLREEERSLLLLIGVEDLSYREAALAFDVPDGTIMSRLSRARVRFRQLVEGGERVALRRVK